MKIVPDGSSGVDVYLDLEEMMDLPSLASGTLRDAAIEAVSEASGVDRAAFPHASTGRTGVYGTIVFRYRATA